MESFTCSCSRRLRGSSYTVAATGTVAKKKERCCELGSLNRGGEMRYAHARPITVGGDENGGRGGVAKGAGCRHTPVGSAKRDSKDEPKVWKGQGGREELAATTARGAGQRPRRVLRLRGKGC